MKKEDINQSEKAKKKIQLHRRIVFNLHRTRATACPLRYTRARKGRSEGEEIKFDRYVPVSSTPCPYVSQLCSLESSFDSTSAAKGKLAD